MIQLALNISNLTLVLFIEACRRIVSMTALAVASFPTPVPALAAITAAINKLDTAYQSGIDGARTPKALTRQLRRDVTDLMNHLKIYVQATATTETMATSSGLFLKRVRQSVIAIGQVLELSAITLVLELGKVQLQWKAVPKRLYYLVYSNPDPKAIFSPLTWKLEATVTVPRCIVINLTSGTRYGFVVVAIGPNNSTGEPSETAIAIAM